MVGQTISHYRITAKLGEGGMGVVYKAEDSNLDRTVALKFLAAHLLESEEHKQRFLREAKATASLDHPNICMVHEVGESDGHVFLAMGFVDGIEVRAKIKERPLKLAEALDIAIQAAEGLRAAHQKGVVHRDIKSSNLMLTAAGQVKIMDFGLAQLTDGTRLTKTDTIIGTPAYMSPEQALRLPTDRRTDIWSLGVVLYEMVTGRLPFEGEREPAVIYSIINEPHEPVTALRAGVPLELDRIVAKALSKDPAQRYQHIDDLLVDLRALAAEVESGRLSTKRQAAAAPRQRSHVWVWAAGGSVALLAAVLALTYLPRSSPPTSAEWERITDFPDSATSPAVSPDGRMVTFIRGGSTFIGRGEIYVKMLPDGQPVQLTNDGMNKMSPVFSPDGSRIAYTAMDQRTNWDTWIVPVLGGEPRRWLPNASGLVWLDKRRVLFSEIKSGMHMALVTATESRAEARDVYVPPHERGMAHRSCLSPDGKWVLLAEMENQGWLPCRVVPFDGSSMGRRVGPSGHCTYAAWSADGKEMYFASDSGGSFHIWRQRFPDGPPEQITSGPTQEEGVALTPDGRSLLTSVGMEQSAIWVRDEHGERQVSFEGNASFTAFATSLPQAFSPSGERLYYLAGTELWAADLASGRNERVLSEFDIATYDISPDGKKVAFSTLDSENRSHLWLAPLDLSSAPTTLGPAEADSPHFGRDGEIFFRAIENGRNFIFRLAANHEQWTKVVSEPVVGLIAVSPGGDWVVGGTSGYVMTAYPAAVGEPVRLCARCLVGWTADRKSFFVWWFIDEAQAQMRAYVLPLPAGRVIPRLPPGGIASEEQITSVGGVLLGEGGYGCPGPDASVYAFTRTSQQRNIYRIPLR